ncbi:MAG: hypothetical protein A2087_02995 [Spirochaetes bacterium GWD1_61_31]|nr:MAG: hypothetical protein A2Y37_14090 [Spirochaetes bacterium GWB1_60_80]OHD34728.1 MAG: hypothetical protein A2004_00165 [Spirochaetes bacterium GWC1_61_12]OHD38736.1 MAG: hypothetical protein A2087_02995 [Spirochaetes bacterium GWD1_61_31]OHD44481.1 MAG: hypothetical protein A2Y35_04930 [Spirochaetes bacterium GWE1_60_18]OHD59369.1 MAG: hypothetical protein A2Y32_08565 [Spirochaetes bacterium GWF1_60_12]
MIDCRPYILKTVSLRYNGADLAFDLSHALFSSNDVDVGSRLLLKSVVRQVPAGSVRSVLDIGSGTGVLGIACAKSFEADSLLLVDRDALAVAFSLHNARRNKCRGVAAETALFLDGLDGRTFDLALCNVPAKAGTPVLDWLLRHLSTSLTPAGVAAIVVVNTIAAAARLSLEAAGVSMKHSEEGKGHTTFLFGRPAEAAGQALPAGQGVALPPTIEIARRTELQAAVLAGKRYAFRGYYGLPEFDTAAFATELAADLYDAAAASFVLQRGLALEPGAGRLPCYLRARGRAPLDLCSRDALALAASRANLTLARPAGGAPSAETGAAAVVEPEADYAFLEDVPASSCNLLAAFPEVIPGADRSEAFWQEAARVLQPGGLVLAVLPATFFDRLEKRKPRGFVKQRQKKRKGQVGAVWRFEGLPDVNG